MAATDPDCGVNSIVNYTILNDANSAETKQFTLDSASGRLCISSELDYEKRAYYEFSVVATDRGKRKRNIINIVIPLINS